MSPPVVVLIEVSKSMSEMKNPFAVTDVDRYTIWEMLVERDITAFCNQDWNMIADDFQERGFFGLHAHGEDNPDKWLLDFPNLTSYHDEWLRQAAEAAQTEFAEPLGEAIHRATSMEKIDLGNKVAVVRKKFDGRIKKADGSEDILNWQTLYFCTKHGKDWKITSFVGYLPHPMGQSTP